MIMPNLHTELQAVTELGSLDRASATYVVAYHANCIDGFTAAWACCRGLIEVCGIEPSTIQTIPANYGIPLSAHLNMERVCTLYIVDFSVPTWELDAFREAGIDTTILDHHKTAAKIYDLPSHVNWYVRNDVKGTDIYYDVKESGASITWKYFFGGGEKHELPFIIELVKDRDLWKFKLGTTKEAHEGLLLRNRSLSVWEGIAQELKLKGIGASVITEGTTALKVSNRLAKEIAENATQVNLLGVRSLIAPCPKSLTSDVGNILAERTGRMGVTYIIVPETPDSPKTVRWSLRSVGGFSVRALAENFGGGGHDQAAGFETGVDALLALL